MYKWISVIFLVGYVIYIIYDDYIFVDKIYSLSDLGTFLLIEFMYLFVYFLGFSFYYWLISLLIIFGYRVVKR